MVRDIVHDPIFLAQKSVDATKDDIEVAKDLLDTLRAHTHECVGMAANMIGIKKNIIVIGAGLGQFVMINPKILSKDGLFETEEGCLSLLGGPRKCTRYENIEVSYLDINWNPKRQKYSGWTAQIIQHEIDHTNGVLI